MEFFKIIYKLILIYFAFLLLLLFFFSNIFYFFFSFHITLSILFYLICLFLPFWVCVGVFKLQLHPEPRPVFQSFQFHNSIRLKTDSVTYFLDTFLIIIVIATISSIIIIFTIVIVTLNLYLTFNLKNNLTYI